MSPSDFATLMLALVVAGCSSRSPVLYPTGDVVVIDGRADYVREPRHPGDIPPGHYPPPGECRIWYPDRPPGHQPPPVRCEELYSEIAYGAFVLHNSKAWDSRYDWRKHERRNPDSVPKIVLRLMSRLVDNE